MPKILLKEHAYNPSDSPVAMARRRPQWPFGIHAHEFSELVIICGGRGNHITETEFYPLKKGDVFIITARHAHGYTELKNLNLINIFFDPFELDLNAQDINTMPSYHALFTLEPAYRARHNFKSKLELNDAELDRLCGLVDRLDEELRAQAGGYRTMVCALFVQIAVYLSRCYKEKNDPALHPLLRIGEVISHLERNYDQETTLEQLSRMARMSKRNLLRVFHETMGDSPMNHLLKRRLSKARELLLHSSMSITEVGFESGFQDSNYFSRQFRRMYGTSPRSYRLERKKPLDQAFARSPS